MKKVVMFALGLALLVAVIGSTVISGILTPKLDTSIKDKEIVEELQAQENVFDSWKTEGKPSGSVDIVEYTDPINGQEFYNFNVYLYVGDAETKCAFSLSKEMITVQPIYLTPYSGFCDYFKNGKQLEKVENADQVVNGMLCFSESCTQSSFVEFQQRRTFNTVSLSR